MTIPERAEIIINYTKGKDVLDLGCIDTFSEKSKEDRWLHAILLKNSKSLLGVDIEKKEVNKLKKEGYDMICADVENMDLKKRFDVVVAGELIEHLDNPGLFLDNVDRHLKDDGTFILTTPSPYYLINLIKVFKTKLTFNQSKFHVALYTPATLTCLLSRHGFKTESIHFAELPIKKQYKPLKLLIKKLFPYLQLYIIIIAKKQ
jgi:2-polyprenyl-3-methyl-5-hydroxy-6-metoxy-1,4-benzoquinol methylase